MKQDAKYIRWFENIRNEGVSLVGRKNASLGEMYSELTTNGVKVPDGFAITADAYRHAISVNPDALLKIALRVVEMEEKMKAEGKERKVTAVPR
ncbi:hypothetical protein ES707_10019 [subsurface metagenome]